MKKIVFVVLTLSLVSFAGRAMAEDTAVADASTQAAAQPVAPAAAITEASAPVAAAEAVPAVTSEAAIENLEFISGEVSAVDEAAKSLTVKLYGETENEANDKILTVTLDDATDITDGEKDRDLKSLTAGTEVDVEYDPSTNKATYIFVY